MSLEEAKQIPTWFMWIMFMAVVALLIWALKYIINVQKQDWTEVKTNMKELIMIQKLHTYRIDENTNDIKDIQDRLNGMNGPLLVKYDK